MDKMKFGNPKKITRPEPYLIYFEWADGFSGIITIEKFRQECPCAQCKGEELGGKKYIMPMLNQFKPGMYDLQSLTKVGNYAINPVWGDEHDTGIYNWDYLREIVEENALSEDEIDKIKHQREKGNNKGLL